MLRPWNLEIRIRNTEKPIYLQVADAIIESIKTGKLSKGDALPGTRQLAGLVNVNRNTIVGAMDVLIAEGWLVAVERKGMFVADVLPIQKHAKPLPEHRSEHRNTEVKAAIVFDDGWPDSRLAPMNEIARAYRQIFNRKSRWQIMGYSHELGDLNFRKAIVQMLNFRRGMNVSSSQVCITRGSQMAMYLAAHSLLRQGDLVAVENPGYQPAWQTFEHAGAKLLPVCVDSEGLIVDELEKLLKKHKTVRAIYVTPHHQFPTTVTMSLKRRQRLIELSNQYGFTIIEDDYDHEFHFGQRPVLPLASFEHAKHWIYIGTLSKIVAPALRVGYMVSDSESIAKVGCLRKIIDMQGDNIMEEAVLQLINGGEIKRHLKRTTLIYKAKRDFFEKMCHKHLKGKVSFVKPDGGLAFWVMPLKKTDAAAISARLLKSGVKILPPDSFGIGKAIQGFRLGYASLSEKQIEEGLMALAKCL